DRGGFFPLTCHIPLASRTAKSRPLREGRPPAAPEGAGTGQGSGRHTLTRLTPGSLLRPRRPVSPETLRPGPIGRRRPSPPGRFNIFPVGQGSSWGWSVPKRGRENRPSARARMGPQSAQVLTLKKKVISPQRFSSRTGLPGFSSSEMLLFLASHPT
uniref:Uncharacterized protein n=1 Tax=Mustela putorius furo TaxID=9669 RepID=M3XPG7_MUSPF